MRDLTAITVFLVVYIVLPLLAIAGWVMNLLKLWPLLHGAITGEVILRIAGAAIAPLGAVLGWFL